METGNRFIVFIDYSEPDMAPNCPGFDSQPSRVFIMRQIWIRRAKELKPNMTKQ